MPQNELNQVGKRRDTGKGNAKSWQKSEEGGWQGERFEPARRTGGSCLTDDEDNTKDLLGARSSVQIHTKGSHMVRMESRRTTGGASRT